MICSIEGCEKSNQVRRGLCAMHYRRWYIHGDALVEFKPGAQPGVRVGPKSPVWVGDAVKYKSAHSRVRRHRGSASSYICAHCGEQAHEWAYARTDQNPLVGRYRGFEMEYSGDPDHYIPLCVTCHRRFDSKVKV